MEIRCFSGQDSLLSNKMYIVWTGYDGFKLFREYHNAYQFAKGFYPNYDERELELIVNEINPED